MNARKRTHTLTEALRARYSAPGVLAGVKKAAEKRHGQVVCELLMYVF